MSGQFAIFEPPVKYQSIEMPIFRQKLCNCKHLCKRQNLNVLNNQIINCNRVSAVFQHWSLRNFRFCKRPFALQGSYKSYLYLIKFQTIQINRSTKLFRNRRSNCESSWQSLNQCLGSGSVGSARFWLPGSVTGSAKICGSTGQNINQKLKKKNFTLKIQI